MERTDLNLEEMADLIERGFMPSALDEVALFPLSLVNWFLCDTAEYLMRWMLSKNALVYKPSWLAVEHKRLWIMGDITDDEAGKFWYQSKRVHFDLERETERDDFINNELANIRDEDIVHSEYQASKLLYECTWRCKNYSEAHEAIKKVIEFLRTKDFFDKKFRDDFKVWHQKQLAFLCRVWFIAGKCSPRWLHNEGLTYFPPM